MNQEVKNRVLICSIRLPNKNGKGDQTLMYNRLKFLLEKKYAVDLIYFDIGKNQKLDIDNELLQLHPIKFSYIESFKNLLTGLFSKTPFQVIFFKSISYMNTFNLLVNKRNYAFIYSCLIRNNENIFSSDKATNIYIDAVDSMTLNFYRRMKSTSNLFFRLIIRIEYLRLQTYEKVLLSKKNIKKIFLVSPIDKSYFPENLAINIPLGVNINNFPIRKRIITNDIIFFGNLNYFPNVNAIHWFVIQCWPKIVKKLPKTKLLIVGSNPEASIKRLQTDKIIVTGRVPSINDYLQNASISVAPLFDGSGMQNKILESMSCGVPVITTNIGFGGISSEAKDFISIYDDPKEFSDACIELILNKEKNYQFGYESRQFIEKNHCVEVVNNKFIKELN